MSVYMCHPAMTHHSIVPPPPPHQFRLNPGSVIVLDHFFLDIEVILNMLKATTGILYLVNIILLSIPQYFHF